MIVSSLQCFFCNEFGVVSSQTFFYNATDSNDLKRRGFVFFSRRFGRFGRFFFHFFARICVLFYYFLF
ncbi:hypothetical protein AB674_13175 [Flavobacterium sp. ABG]|nr:hypothetical protein AB674_13175 [Flavobacterium sp. ABG]